MMATNLPKGVLVAALIAAAGVVAFLVLQRSSADASCGDSYETYFSRIRDVSFCYPKTWRLLNGDSPLLPESERPQGYTAYIQLERPGPPSVRAYATAWIMIAGELGQRDSSGNQMATTILDCEAPQRLAVGDASAKVCYFEPAPSPQVSPVPPGTLRLIGIEVGFDKPVVMGAEIFKFEGDHHLIAARAQDEVLDIAASVREGSRR